MTRASRRGLQRRARWRTECVVETRSRLCDHLRGVFGAMPRFMCDRACAEIAGWIAITLELGGVMPALSRSAVAKARSAISSGPPGFDDDDFDPEFADFTAQRITDGLEGELRTRVCTIGRHRHLPRRN